MTVRTVACRLTFRLRSGTVLFNAMQFVATHPMKLFLQTTMIFFGTLLAAALVALGAPGDAEVQMAIQTPAAESVVSVLGLDD